MRHIETEEERREITRKVLERQKKENWGCPRRAAVVSQKFGSVIVPCRSPLAAIHCAAEMLKIPVMDLLKDARVYDVNFLKEDKDDH